MQTLDLQINGLSEISDNELVQIEGGVAPVVVAAGAVLAGCTMIFAGALVGYAIYKAVDYITK